MKSFLELTRERCSAREYLPKEIEDEMLASLRLSPEGKSVIDWQGKSYPLPEGVGEEGLAVWYSDNVIYPDKVRLNKYYYEHYSFLKDIEMIFATVLGKKIQFAGEEV